MIFICSRCGCVCSDEERWSSVIGDVCSDCIALVRSDVDGDEIPAEIIRCEKELNDVRETCGRLRTRNDLFESSLKLLSEQENAIESFPLYIRDFGKYIRLSFSDLYIKDGLDNIQNASDKLHQMRELSSSMILELDAKRQLRAKLTDKLEELKSKAVCDRKAMKSETSDE